MGCTERIICALGALGEPGKPTPLPQGADAVAPSCKNFVRIALMADIPDQPVMRCVENVMNGGGEFDHAKAGDQMPARHAHRKNHFLRSEEHTSDIQTLMRISYSVFC